MQYAQAAAPYVAQGLRHYHKIRTGHDLQKEHKYSTKPSKIPLFTMHKYNKLKRRRGRNTTKKYTGKRPQSAVPVRNAKRRKPNSKLNRTKTDNTVVGPNSYFKLTYKPQSKNKFDMIRFLGNGATYTTGGVFYQSTTESLQAAKVISNIGINTDMIAIYQFANKAYNATGAAWISQSSSASGARSQKMLWKRTKQVINFKNQTASSIQCTVYHLVAKVTGTYTDPISLWTAGLGNQSGPGVSALVQTVGQKPTMSKNFNMSWKIVKRQTYRLAAGQDVTNYFDFRPQRYIDMEYFNSFGMVRGLTTATILVQNGFVGDTSPSLTAGNIGLGVTKIVGTWNNTSWVWPTELWR